MVEMFQFSPCEFHFLWHVFRRKFNLHPKLIRALEHDVLCLFCPLIQRPFESCNWRSDVQLIDNSLPDLDWFDYMHIEVGISIEDFQITAYLAGHRIRSTEIGVITWPDMWHHLLYCFLELMSRILGFNGVVAARPRWLLLTFEVGWRDRFWVLVIAQDPAIV